MHPAVAKARFVGKVAHEHNWKGKLASETINSERHTMLSAMRNDERLEMEWRNEKLCRAEYFIFDRKIKLTCSKQAIDKVTGWPDILKLFEWFPNMNRPNLVQTYRNLPFSVEDDNEEIISKLLGCKIFWYGHETSKYHTDVVLPKKSAKVRIQDVGHRKMFHFIGAQAGFRSVLLDTVLKVA